MNGIGGSESGSRRDPRPIITSAATPQDASAERRLLRHASAFQEHSLFRPTLDQEERTAESEDDADQESERPHPGNIPGIDER